MKYILGKKLGMTHIFDEKGRSCPATLLEAGPCVVTQVLTEDKNGYYGVQIGFLEKKLNKPEAGHVKKFIKNGKGYSKLKEFRTDKEAETKLGDSIMVAQFEPNDKVNVRSVTKGKGFQGVVKRWNFAGGPASHGQKHTLRTPGSIGSAYPQHVMKGKKMAGRMGGKNKTIKNLKVVDIIEDKNVLVVKGAVPGNNGAIVEITSV